MKWIDRFVCGKSNSCRAALMALFLTKYQRHAKGSLSPKISTYLGAAPTPSENFMCFDACFLASDFFFWGGIFSKSLCDVN